MVKVVFLKAQLAKHNLYLVVYSEAKMIKLLESSFA